MTQLTKQEIATPFGNQYSAAKIAKIARMVDFGMNPYPSSSNILKNTTSISEFNSEFLTYKEKKVTLIGRIKFHRKMGKIEFLNIENNGNNVQVVMTREDTKNYSKTKSLLDVGDIIKVKGVTYVTEKNQNSLMVKKWSMVTKSTDTPVGKGKNGLLDEETLIRQRYLDLMHNDGQLQKLKLRTKVISTIRKFFEKKGFDEVETPILNPIPGGANAKPFVTHHSALGVDRYLRIAPELYLKKLLVGGFEKVFEIGKNFRNEGIDATHNPEFTVIELYETYVSYESHMDMIQKMFKKIIKKLDLELNHTYGDNVIDFNNWTKITFREALLTIGDIPSDIIDEPEQLSNYLNEVHGMKKANATLKLGQLWTIAFDELVEEKLINPTFITEYPSDISPLARKMDLNPKFCERYELFISGMELANGFNEMNNPVEQYIAFRAQVEGKDSDDEAMHMDVDYIKALMSGLPPCSGTGIGIDRLVMLLTNSKKIKDVIAFPATR